MSPLPTDTPAVPASAKVAGAAVGGAVLAVGLVKLEGTARVVLICGVVAVALLLAGYVLFTKWYAGRKAAAGDEEIMEELRGKPQGLTAEQQAQVADFSRKFEEGVAKFKANGLKLSELPWYLLVGEPGSGKSEAVRRCGLDFPPGLNEEYQGAGGTVNMDWWFTDSGIILDTAGRFVADAPGSGAEWQKFLNLLNKVRHDCPVNGLMLAIPATSLLKDSAEQIQAKAANSAKFIDKLRRSLGIRFPVFVVVTKSDLIPGFREFFSSVNDPDLQHQMLGWSNPANLDDPFDPDEVDDYLAEVRAKLVRRRLALLVDPVNTVDPAASRLDEVDALYLFPDALAGIAPRLRRYLQGIFVKSKFNQAPLFLRGIYFTSAMEEGAALDAKLAEIRGITLEQMAAEGSSWKRERAVFLRDVFTKKVFEEWGLVTRDLNVDRGQRRRKVAVLAAGFACVMLLLGLTFWNASRLERSVGGPRDLWADVLKNRPSLAILTPGKRYNGEPLQNALAGREALTPAQFFARRQAEAARPIDIPWFYGFSESGLNAKRLEASRALFDASVVTPVVRAARERMRPAPAAASKGGATTRPSWAADGAATAALVELIHLDRIANAKTMSADDRVMLDPLFRVALVDEKPYRPDAKALQDAFDAFHLPAAGASDAERKRLGESLARAAGGADAKAIESGVEQFAKYWQDALGPNGAEMAPIREIRSALERCAEADERLRKFAARTDGLTESDYRSGVADLQGYVRDFADAARSAAAAVKLVEPTWTDGSSLHDYVGTRHEAFARAAVAARDLLKKELQSGGEALAPLAKRLDDRLGDLLKEDALKKSRDDTVAALGRVDWLLAPVDGGRACERLVAGYQKVADAADHATDGSVRPRSWKEVLALFENGGDAVKEARGAILTDAQVGRAEQVRQSRDAAAAILGRFVMAGVRYAAVRSRLEDVPASAERFGEAVKAEAAALDVKPWVVPATVPLTDLTEGKALRPEFNPDAARSVADTIGRVAQKLAEPNVTCVEQTAVRAGVRRWSDALGRYAAEYAKYWAAEVSAAPRAAKSWDELVGFLVREKVIDVNGALKKVAQLRRKALDAMPDRTAEIASVEKELADLDDAGRNGERDAVMRRWAGLPGGSRGARAAILEMPYISFFRDFCSNDPVPYWRQLPLSALQTLGDSTGPDAKAALDEFNKSYAGRFPLNLTARDSRLSRDEAEKARGLLAGLVSTKPAGASAPDPNKPIRDGGRSNGRENPIDGQLNRLFAATQGPQLVGQFRLLNALLAPDVACDVQLAGAPDGAKLPPDVSAAVDNWTKVKVTYGTTVSKDLYLGTPGQSLVRVRYDGSDNGPVTLHFSQTDQANGQGLDVTVDGPWAFLNLIKDPSATHVSSDKGVTWTAPLEFKGKDGSTSYVVWLKLNFGEAGQQFVDVGR